MHGDRINFKDAVSPIQEICDALDNMGSDFMSHTIMAMAHAFPEYHRKCYSVADMIISEIMRAIDFEYQEECQFDCVECMSGKGELRKAVVQRGLRAVGLDKKYACQEQDMTTQEGFRTFLLALRRLRRHGLWWMAPECTTWIWIGRFQTGRHKNIEGYDHVPAVQDANIVRDRVCLLALICYWSCRDFIAEQPNSTVIHVSTPFLHMMQMTRANSICTEHGAFSEHVDGFCRIDSSRKPLKLMGTAPWMLQLTRTCRTRRTYGTLYTQRVDQSTGKRRVDGKKKELEESEHYSVEFGKEVARCLATHLIEMDLKAFERLNHAVIDESSVTVCGSSV